MFLNFIMSEEVRPFCGVDVSNVRTKEGCERGHIGGWGRWGRKMVGLVDSPHHTFQDVTWAKKISLGSRRVPINPFKWDRVVVNFPGSGGYDCRRSWLYKECTDGMITADLFIYVDERRPIGPTEEIFWETS